MLNRNQILKNTKLKQEVVAIPEWDGEVIVRELTGAERAELESIMAPAARGGAMPVDYPQIRAKVATWVVLDESGGRMFNPEDVKLVADMSSSAIERIWNATAKMSGMGPKDKETARKNSESSQSANSGTP